jgi:hypothetical protein
VGIWNGDTQTVSGCVPARSDAVMSKKIENQGKVIIHNNNP